MQKKRPVNLNLFTIRFPITAISSILHRISGVILFFSIVFLLYVLQQSLASADSFAAIQTTLSQPVARFFTWVVLSAVAFHAIAGVRHLFMDMGYGEGKDSGRLGAYLVIIFSILVIVALGVRLW
ncbi:MAG: succinate dehydrogenase [Gammaproteobacteria bacterium]|jgi:succinate dehydrogenase / fumarate reductase cytochrome b subunit|nr:succinate dehydrogenase [Gammaproteobacteria bacterium]